MYGSYLNFATPGQFDLGLSVQFVAMIIVGGMGSLWGPVLGALFVWGLQSELDSLANSLPFLQGGTRTTGIPVGDAAAILYGLLLIVFLLAEPRGVVGLGHRANLLAGRLRVRLSTPGVVSSVTSPDS